MRQRLWLTAASKLTLFDVLLDFAEKIGIVVGYRPHGTGWIIAFTAQPTLCPRTNDGKLGLLWKHIPRLCSRASFPRLRAANRCRWPSVGPSSRCRYSLPLRHSPPSPHHIPLNMSSADAKPLPFVYQFAAGKSICSSAAQCLCDGSAHKFR